MSDMLMFSAAQTTDSFQLQKLELQVLFLVKGWIVNNNTGCIILFWVVVDGQLLNLNIVLKIYIND